MNASQASDVLSSGMTITTGQFNLGEAISVDGTCIGYRQIGTGPGLVMMHGGLRASQHYERLALALADSYTVTIPDRRGRGLSGSVGDEYSIRKEIQDVRAVLLQTGSRMLFGHSAGAIFALEAALVIPVKKLILYEPPVSINGSVSFDWLPAFEKALDRQDHAAAFVQMVKGLRLSGMSQLPAWLLSPIARLLLSGKGSRELTGLMRTLVWEAKEIQHLEQMGQTYERYRDITADTLLLYGSKSPEYLRNAVSVLEATIPQAHLANLPGQDHNAPDENAPEVVAAAIKFFLS